MKNELKEFILSIVDNYNSNEAEYYFNLIKEKATKEQDFDYVMCSVYFDHEPHISYLLYKESYKLVLLESLKDIKSEDNENVKAALYKMLAGLYGINTFDTEEIFLAEASRDAYQEVLGEDFPDFLIKTFEVKKDLIIKTLNTNNSDRYNIYNHYKESFKNSIYKKELMSILDSVF